MAFVTITNTDDIVKSEENKGNKFIHQSGMFETTLNHISVGKSKGGAQEATFSFGAKDTDEPTGTIYGLYLTDNAGKESFGMNTLKSLMVIEGLQSLEDAVSEEFTFGNKTVTLDVLPDLRDIPVIVRILRTYKKYNGEVREYLNVKGFYRVEDNATASEILKGTPYGVKYEKDLEYADGDFLKEVTEEEAEAYRKAKSAEYAAKRDDKPAADKPAKKNPFGN